METWASHDSDLSLSCHGDAPWDTRNDPIAITRDRVLPEVFALNLRGVYMLACFRIGYSDSIEGCLCLSGPHMPSKPGRLLRSDETASLQFAIIGDTPHEHPQHLIFLRGSYPVSQPIEPPPSPLVSVILAPRQGLWQSRAIIEQ